MEKCPICRIKDANKKNVHLIPWFLIKNSITLNGTGERNKELSFRIGANTFPTIYAGRSILPEHLDEFSDLDISQNEEENHYSRDYLICSDCEDKISRLEAIFAFEFSDKKIKNNLNYISYYKNSILINAKYNFSLYQLFIQSIFYRCSKGLFNGFKLNLISEEKIEKNLRLAFLSMNFKKIHPGQQFNIVNPFPIITCSFCRGDGDDSTTELIYANQSRFPYFIIAGKWMFQLFEAEKHLKSTIESLFGLRSQIKPFEAYSIIKNTSHTVILEQMVGRLISNNLTQFIAEKRVIGLKRTIKSIYFQKFKLKPDKDVVYFLLKRFFFHFEDKSEINSMFNAFNDLFNLNSKN